MDNVSILKQQCRATMLAAETESHSAKAWLRLCVVAPDLQSTCAEGMQQPLFWTCHYHCELSQAAMLSNMFGRCNCNALRAWLNLDAGAFDLQQPGAEDLQ